MNKKLSKINLSLQLKVDSFQIDHIYVFFQVAGSSIDSNICTIILGIVNIMATIFSNTFIDRLGRKVLLYISSVGMILSLSILGTYFYYKVS